MRLTDNEHINETVAKLLIADNWTIEKLATTQPDNLTKYKGVGNVTAGRIIAEAKRMVNEARLNEAAKFEPPTIPEEPGDLPPMSVRVRRLRELNND